MLRKKHTAIQTKSDQSLAAAVEESLRILLPCQNNNTKVAFHLSVGIIDMP